MQIRDLSKPVTSKGLNESLAKQFGYRLNLEQFSDVQLEDARNKLRTKISQFEVSESYDGIQESPEYQKTRAMLDCVNHAIMERTEEKEKCCCDEMGQDECPIHCDDEPGEHYGKHDHSEHRQMKEADMRKKLQAEKMKQKAREHAVPESWIDSAIDRMELGESDQEELAAELITRYDLRESVANRIVYLSEGEAEKAEAIMASKDMVERITGWLEDVSALKSEQLLELLDSIRENLGSDVAQQYQAAVKPALESIYTSLETSRQGLSKGLALLAGGDTDTMGSEPAPDMGGAASAPDMGGAAPDMGGEEPAPGGEAPDMGGDAAGRMKRESVDYSRRLGMLLAQSKKK